MPAKDDRTSERRAQILQAAAAVYARQGIDGARMDDIVAEAGLSKGTLYWYFDSKDDITIALFNEMISGEFELLRQLLDAEGTVIERLERFFDVHASILQANPMSGKLGIEFYAIAGKLDKVHELVRRYYDEFVEAVLTLVKQGEERGELHVERPRELAANLVALVEGSSLLWALDFKEVDLAQQFRNAIALLFDGLRA
jgi:TetR/AcrR family acrAB operon transcriptional repressor